MNFRRLTTAILITFFLFALTVSLGFAQDKKVPTPTPTPKPKVEYVLPYPGILPGHPLFFLKSLRDRLVEFFISDPLKKAEYHLLLADKWLNSGLFLLEQGKTDLAERAFAKGEKYLEDALGEAEKAQKAGKDTSALMSKLSLATLKHQEVLTEVLGKIPEPAKKGLQNALEKSQKGIERIREIQKKKIEQRLQERMLGQKKSLVKPAMAEESQETTTSPKTTKAPFLPKGNIGGQ